MNHEGELPQPETTAGATAPPASASRSWFGRYGLVVMSAAGALVLGAVAVAAVLFLSQPNPSIEKMVPATHDALVIANLNPSLGQKINLLRAVHSFPDTSTDAAISSKLDAAFKAAGLSYTSDVQPWLGGEVGASGTVNFASGADSPFAMFATSRDDTKAKALLAKLRSGSFGQKYTWRDETYNGISIASGTPTVTSEKPVAYSLVDHVVVAASSAAMIHEIIDTDQGRSARLVDSADFKATMKLLPSDRVGMGYLAGKSLVAGVKAQMAKPSTLGLPALKTVDDLNALQGIGGAVSASSTGVAFDVAVKLDPNQLSPATRQAFVATRRPDVVLRWIPKSSDGFIAFGNLDQTIKSLLAQYGTDASVQASTSAIGLTGPQGILPHLTGDLGIEVELGNNSIPSGAILLGTNDSAAMNAFFSKLLGLAAATSQQAPGAGITRTTYRGTVITSWTSPSLGQVPGLAPSYAAVDGMGILASSPAEIKAVIDAHAGGSNITVDSTYRSASIASLTQPTGIMYLNVARVVSALETLRGSSTVDSKTAAYLAPLKAFMLTATSQAGAAMERFFVVIK
jgi:Protein of unknown function (DUF3352)